MSVVLPSRHAHDPSVRGDMMAASLTEVAPLKAAVVHIDHLFTSQLPRALGGHIKQ